MPVHQIKFEGVGDIDGNQLICVCAFCGQHESARGTIEFNFREQKIFYLCNHCGKINEVFFGTKPKPPLPKIGIM